MRHGTAHARAHLPRQHVAVGDRPRGLARGVRALQGDPPRGAGVSAGDESSGRLRLTPRFPAVSHRAHQPGHVSRNRPPAPWLSVYSCLPSIQMMHKVRGLLLVAAALAATLGRVEAQSALPSPAGAAPPPAAISTLSRDSSGHVTVRAVRLETPITLDGRLDEEVYRTVEPASGFIQQEPQEGAAGHREDRSLDLLRQQECLRLGAMLGQPAGADGRERDAARRAEHHAERKLRHRPRHVSRPAQRLLFPDEPARRHP